METMTIILTIAILANLGILAIATFVAWGIGN